jgi:hypothetical protein
MTIEQIQKAQQASPFRPFKLRTGGGREYSVPHPEFISVLRPTRMLWVYDAAVEDAGDIIDAMLIESIHFDAPPTNGGSRGPNGEV